MWSCRQVYGLQCFNYFLVLTDLSWTFLFALAYLFTLFLITKVEFVGSSSWGPYLYARWEIDLISVDSSESNVILHLYIWDCLKSSITALSYFGRWFLFICALQMPQFDDLYFRSYNIVNIWSETVVISLPFHSLQKTVCQCSKFEENSMRIRITPVLYLVSEASFIEFFMVDLVHLLRPIHVCHD